MFQKHLLMQDKDRGHPIIADLNEEEIERLKNLINLLENLVLVCSTITLTVKPTFNPYEDVIIYAIPI